MSQFYSGCWGMKDRSKILNTCLTFSATFPSFLLKVECWRLEDGKKTEVQNFCGLKIRFGQTFQKKLQISLPMPKGDKSSLLHWNIVAIWWVRRARSWCPPSPIFLPLVCSGPWPKKEDWLKKKDRDQRRPGCRRLKARVSSSSGPLPYSWKTRGLAIGKEGRECFLGHNLVLTLKFLRMNPWFQNWVAREAWEQKTNMASSVFKTISYYNCCLTNVATTESRNQWIFTAPHFSMVW